MLEGQAGRLRSQGKRPLVEDRAYDQPVIFLIAAVTISSTALPTAFSTFFATLCGFRRFRFAGIPSAFSKADRGFARFRLRFGLPKRSSRTMSVIPVV